VHVTGVSEEQICEIFGRVGQVVNFRLVYDKETGRPKGFGFLEYTDTDAAASACRNLNDFDIMGRTLRVDYSNDNGGGKGNQQQQDGSDMRAPPPAHFNVNSTTQANGADSAALPVLPAGQDLPPGLTAPDAISATLSSIPAPQLLDIISQMKNLTTTSPQQAQSLLAQAPQLGYAIFQALLLLGLADTNVLTSLIQQNAAAPPSAAQEPRPQQQQQQQQQVPPGGQFPPHQPPLYAPQHQAQAPVYQQQPYTSPPSAVPQASAHQAPAPPAAAPTPDPGHAALIQQVLAMTREQIFALDEVPRGQILALRQQLGAPVG